MVPTGNYKYFVIFNFTATGISDLKAAQEGVVSQSPLICFKGMPNSPICYQIIYNTVFYGLAYP